MFKKCAKIVFSSGLSILSIFGLWYLGIWFSGLPEFVIPRPESVLAVLFKEWDFIFTHLIQTLVASALGFIAANIVGIGLAILITAFPILDVLLIPAAITMRNIPYVALATILALALGDSLASKVIIIAVAWFFPVMVNTSKGLQSVDVAVIDRMKILNAPLWQIFIKVRLPYALPFILAAQEIVGSGSIAISIAAEWMISTNGLGYVINRAMSQYRGDEVYAVALLSAFISYVVYLGIHQLGKKSGWTN